MASGDSRVSGVSGRELLEDSTARERGGGGEGGCETLNDNGSRGSGSGERSWRKRQRHGRLLCLSQSAGPLHTAARLDIYPTVVKILPIVPSSGPRCVQ